MFRADIPIKFRVTPSAFQTLIDDLEETMKFSIEQEEKVPMEYVTNFAEVVDFYHLAKILRAGVIPYGIHVPLFDSRHKSYFMWINLINKNPTFKQFINCLRVIFVTL